LEDTLLDKFAPQGTLPGKLKVCCRDVITCTLLPLLTGFL